MCNPADHVITGDLKIINNTSLRDVSTKGPKYREPKSINRKHNFKILMDTVQEYARQWTNREKEDLDTLSEWVKSVRSLIQMRPFNSVILLGLPNAPRNLFPNY